MKRISILLVAALLATFGRGVEAADHIDSPAAISEPTADISDLYAWMSDDASKLNLIMNVNPFAGGSAEFSDAAQYVFHVNSSAAYGAPQTETPIICEFFDVSMIECWANGSYVIGDPSDPAGIVSEDGALRVFAGLRDDPFFMEFNGFTATVETVVAAAPGLSFDDDGCPALDSETGEALRTQLQSGASGEPASDTFAGSNVLSLVVQIDVDKVDGAGSLLGVWSSTHRK